MHPTMTDEIVKICKRRSHEGDHPTTPALSVEQLESCVLELALQLQILGADEPSIEAYKLFRQERRLREAAERNAQSRAVEQPNLTEHRCTPQPKETKMSDAMTFNNGLTTEQDDAIDDIMIDISRLTLRVEALGRHRSYSLAATKLEEAKHWMRDRKHKPA